MVDLLGRAGKLNEAEDLINTMPFENSATAWSCLLGSCKIHGDVEQALHSADHIFALAPNNDEAYMTLSNIFAAAGRWDDVQKTREAMKIAGVIKQGALLH